MRRIQAAGACLVVHGFIVLASYVFADPLGPTCFTLAFNGAAMKENQTGLIWEQEPGRSHDV